LTVDDIARRREILRQKQIEKATSIEGSIAQADTSEVQTIDNGESNAVKIATNENNDETMFLAFARVYSGRLKRGEKIFVLGPRHDPKLFIDKVRSMFRFVSLLR
jgi:ribosome assembly protein 1